ncbi:MAG: elongation factor 1-beta [Candidatus Aenigmarchaeota archaeon]|nr:elongation factor 1-beta [Candidatus Aenigmarchaeota archaeon]
MGNVMVIFRVMPESTETDLEKIKTELLKLGSKKVETEPLAFGLNAVKAYFVVPDAEGGAEKLEESVKKIEGVSEAEITEVNRMLY